MRAVAYMKIKFENSFLVSVDAEDGSRFKFECYSYKKAPEIAHKLFPHLDIKWVPKFWEDDVYSACKQNYEHEYMTEFDGRI